MRSLTPTLLAAQRQASSQPYVQAVLSDAYGAVSRLRFSRHYDGDEGEYFSAAAGAGDGALIRARIDPATKVLYTQRVVAPGPESDFLSWTSHGTVSAQGAVAVAASGSSVFLFYVDTDTTTLRLKQSADNGATYGSATTVATVASAAIYLAAAVAEGGDIVLFWSVGASVWTSRFSGSWGTPAAWTNAADSISGIACRWRLDWNVVICGSEDGSGDAKVWTAVYGDDLNQPLDTWSALAEVTTATALTGVAFLAPSLEFLQNWRLFFVEKYTGDEAYSRLQWSTMNGTEPVSRGLWREPAPFDYSGDYGVAMTGRNLGGRLWLSSPAGVWSGEPLVDLDLSQDVIEAVVQIEEDAGRARLLLRNDAVDSAPTGRYAGYGSGDIAMLQRGARLVLAPGYVTPDGQESSAGPSFWVDAIEQVTGPEPRLVILARDGWWLLERWRHDGSSSGRPAPGPCPTCWSSSVAAPASSTGRHRPATH